MMRSENAAILRETIAVTPSVDDCEAVLRLAYQAGLVVAGLDIEPVIELYAKAREANKGDYAGSQTAFATMRDRFHSLGVDLALLEAALPLVHYFRRLAEAHKGPEARLRDACTRDSFVADSSIKLGYEQRSAPKEKSTP